MSDCQDWAIGDDTRMQRIYEYLDGALTRVTSLRSRATSTTAPSARSSTTLNASSATWSSAPAPSPRLTT